MGLRCDKCEEPQDEYTSVPGDECGCGGHLEVYDYLRNNK